MNQTLQEIALTTIPFRVLSTIALSLGVAVPVAAYETDASGIKWKYYNGTPAGDSLANRSYTNAGLIPSGNMSGAAYYAGDFNTLAKPLTAPATLNELDAKISFTLQEKRHIDNSSIVLTNDDQANIKIAPGSTADVWVTFMNEGAGFENSVGFFTYDLNSVPVRNADGSNSLRSEQIFFPRASTSFPLPRSTTSGTTVYLGSFTGGANGLGIGFVIVANGWSSSGRSASPAIPGVKRGHDKSWIYYSLKGLNPECVGLNPQTCTKDMHSIILNDSAVTGWDGVNYRRMVLGFEDFKRTEGGCDHDFNDVLMAIHVTPESAISNLSSLAVLTASNSPDSDGDGVTDTADEFPNDATRAFSRYYPGSSTWGTLAYEDLWPALGDYDLNDVVVRYRSREILNPARAVTALEMDLRLDARGGSLRNGFAVSLPGVPAANVASVVLTKDGVPVPETTVVLVEGATGEQGGVVFEIFDDASTLMPADNAPACSLGGYRNTGRNCPVREHVNYKLQVSFSAAMASFPSPPYDAFIFNSNGTNLAKGTEVHLPGRQPTSRADVWLMGTRDDRTVLNTPNTYKSANGLPWALDIPAEWAYPYEFLDVVNAYPNIVFWAQSGGASNKNWYELSPSLVSKTFRNGR